MIYLAFTDLTAVPRLTEVQLSDQPASSPLQVLRSPRVKVKQEKGAVVLRSSRTTSISPPAHPDLSKDEWMSIRSKWCDTVHQGSDAVNALDDYFDVEVMNDEQELAKLSKRARVR